MIVVIGVILLGIASAMDDEAIEEAGLALGRGQDHNRVITAASHDLTAEARVTIGPGVEVAAPRAVPVDLYPEVQSAMLHPRVQPLLTRMAMIDFRCPI